MIYKLRLLILQYIKVLKFFICVRSVRCIYLSSLVLCVYSTCKAFQCLYDTFYIPCKLHCLYPILASVLNGFYSFLMIMYRLVFTLVIRLPIFDYKQGNFQLIVFTYFNFLLLILNSSKRFKQGNFQAYMIYLFSFLNA